MPRCLSVSATLCLFLCLFLRLGQPSQKGHIHAHIYTLLCIVYTVLYIGITCSYFVRAILNVIYLIQFQGQAQHRNRKQELVADGTNSLLQEANDSFEY